MERFPSLKPKEKNNNLKTLLPITAILFALHGFGQTTTENQVLKLSGDIFKWETENKTDLLENIFDNKFVVVNAEGEIQTKSQYLTLLQSGNFKHDSITVEENTAMVVDNTAVVAGKGRFVVTRSGKIITLQLPYLEVFTRPKPEQDWKILAMHASLIPN
jgi:hypothetical protein